MNAMAQQAERKLKRRRDVLTRVWRENMDEEAEAAAERPADWPDRAQENETVSLLENLSQRERAELLAIDAALARVRQGSFGDCERCGEAIGRERLRAIPEARYCVACEAAVEREG